MKFPFFEFAAAATGFCYPVANSKHFWECCSKKSPIYDDCRILKNGDTWSGGKDSSCKL